MAFMKNTKICVSNTKIQYLLRFDNKLLPCERKYIVYIRWMAASKAYDNSWAFY